MLAAHDRTGSEAPRACWSSSTATPRSASVVDVLAERARATWVVLGKGSNCSWPPTPATSGCRHRASTTSSARVTVDAEQGTVTRRRRARFSRWLPDAAKASSSPGSSSAWASRARVGGAVSMDAGTRREWIGALRARPRGATAPARACTRCEGSRGRVGLPLHLDLPRRDDRPRGHLGSLKTGARAAIVRRHGVAVLRVDAARPSPWASPPAGSVFRNPTGRLGGQARRGLRAQGALRPAVRRSRPSTRTSS